MCGPFSNLQNLNLRTPESEQKVRENEKEAVQHLEYCAEEYEAQISRDGWFLHEHPQAARSWRASALNSWLHDQTFTKSRDIRVGLVCCRSGEKAYYVSDD